MSNFFGELWENVIEILEFILDFLRIAPVIIFLIGMIVSLIGAIGLTPWLWFAFVGFFILFVVYLAIIRMRDWL